MLPTSVQTSPCRRSAQLLLHKPLVRQLAFRIGARTPEHVRMDDLVQAGMIGLNEAMSRFEEGRGASFQTYASRRIEGAMLDSLRQTDTLSRHTRSRLNQVQSAVQQLEHKLGRTPRAKEVANKLGWTLAVFHDCMAEAGAGAVRAGDLELEYHQDVASLHDDIDEGSTEIDELADPQRALQQRQRQEALSAALVGLDERKRSVMEMIYQRDMCLHEIGAVLGISESRVSQIHKEILTRLKRRLRDW